MLSTALLLGVGSVGQASALDTVPGDPGNNAHTVEPLRVMTWNVCGEAGGAGPWASGYCPERNTRLPDGTNTLKKAAQISDVVTGENLDAVLLQEVCAGTRNSNGTRGASQLDQILGMLNRTDTSWSAVSAITPRPNGDSDCRGSLSGDVSVAILAKGGIDWKRETQLPAPAGVQQRGKVLCAGVAGWETHLCTTHLTNYDTSLPSGEAAAAYQAQIGAVSDQVDDFRQVVLGGDFNTRVRDSLQPLYRTLAECDQQGYYAGDTPNEMTKVTNQWLPTADGTLTQGTVQTSKIDYLFATAGFGGCDSLPELADSADYSAQPDCTTSNGAACVPNAPSDHAPLLGTVKGGPRLNWSLRNEQGHSGSAQGGVGWSTEHGGAAILDGTTGEIDAGGPVVDTTRSFTVSAWAKIDPDAGTSVVMAQDGSRISGMMLWFNQGDRTWRFGMPKADSNTWDMDQAISRTPAVPGRWTRLTGTFDALSGAITLYVDGVPVGSAVHPATWRATGAFTVGRDKVSGHANAFWKGSLQSVTTFDYAMTAAQVASAAGALTAPTRTGTAPGTETNGPGCHNGSYTAGDFGTVPTTTPELTAYVAHPDPSHDVWAEFSIWDNTDPQQPQPIYLGGPGSASGKVLGEGTVSVRPTLLAGHKYGWYVRTADGTSAPSPTAAVCHFTVASS